jgi:methylmalonyl-CoA mutase
MSDLVSGLTAAFPPAQEADWMVRVESVLKGADFSKRLVSRTYDGIAIQPLYARNTSAPLVTGTHSGIPWRVMARVDHPVADEAARLAREDLEGGADALTLVFQGGRSARGHGLASGSVEVLDAALSGVHLDLIKIRLEPGTDVCAPALAMAALVQRRKLNPAAMAIDFGIDPVGSLAFLGHATWNWPAMATEMGSTVRTLMAAGYQGPFLSVDIRPYHEAGASEGQELAAALAQGVLYVRALEANGVALSDAFQAVSFSVAVDGDQFLGTARLRALRKLWERVTELSGQEAKPVMVHAETSWRMLTQRDPHVNILRSTVATFAAGIGGADSVTVLPFTQALGLPDAAARRLARNTSIVLMEEAQLWRVADPSAGSGGIEALTNDLCATAWTLFQEIEREGGLLESLTTGALQGRIAATATARAKATATRKEPITGTSEFANVSEIAPAVLDVARVKPDAVSGPVNIHIQPLISQRLAEPFEALRDRADALLAQTGTRPQVQLVTIGPLADHAARLAFTRNLFEAGGMVVSDTGKLVCLVGSDTAYADSAAEVARKLVAAGATVWLAGKPGELENVLRNAGVSRFIFAGCDVVDSLGVALEHSA